MKKIALAALLIAESLAIAASCRAAGESGGLTVLQTPSARAAALGEAYSAAQNDATAFSYNPASLSSLDSAHASFFYEKGLIEDAYGQLMIGSPLGSSESSLGLGVGYYDGGSITLFDGTREQSVTAQKDLLIQIGYATAFGPLSLGIAGKYISSKLIDSVSATAFAGDAGAQLSLGRRIVIGAAAQNFGGELKFISEADPLPRIARFGAAIALSASERPTRLFLDAPYFLNEGELRPGAGIETYAGPIALRGGFRREGDTNEFSAGTGLAFGRAAVDYAFGLVQTSESHHRVSLSLRFGGAAAAPPLVTTAPRFETSTTPLKPRKVQEQPRPVLQVEGEKADEWKSLRPARAITDDRQAEPEPAQAAPKRRFKVYQVRPGDTLGGIARRMYGDSRLWKKIFTANRHQMADPRDLEVGQRILLP